MSISNAAQALTGIEGKIELLALNLASCDWSCERRLAESSAWSWAWNTALEDRAWKDSQRLFAIQEDRDGEPIKKARSDEFYSVASHGAYTVL
jgi:hypothetical protein